MNMNKKLISSMQFFMTLFLCETFLFFGFSKYTLSGGSVFWALLFSVLAGVLPLLAALPSYFLMRDAHKSFSVLLSDWFPRFSLAVKLFYLVCFCVFCAYLLTVYSVFLTEQINRDSSAVVVIALLLLICAFCSAKGTEALTRTAVIVFVFAVFTLLFLLVGLAAKVDMSNLAAVFKDQKEGAADTLVYLGLSVLPICTLPFFLKNLKGKTMKNLLVFSLLSFVFTAVTAFFLLSVLGPYAQTQNYPAFTLAKMAEISILKGGDGMLFALLTGAVFIFVSLFFITGNKVISAHSSKAFSIAFAVVTFALCMLMRFVPGVFQFFTNKIFLLILSVTAAFFIPLGLLCYKKMRKRGERI